MLNITGFLYVAVSVISLPHYVNGRRRIICWLTDIVFVTATKSLVLSNTTTTTTASTTRRATTVGFTVLHIGSQVTFASAVHSFQVTIVMQRG